MPHDHGPGTVLESPVMAWRTWLPLAAAASISTVTACGQRFVPTAQAGRMLYAENGCASCHGPQGRGDGPLSLNSDPRPRDLRDAAAFRFGSDRDAIAQTLAVGIPAVQEATSNVGDSLQHHRHSMPKFDHLSAVERQSLALYVMSLRGPSGRGDSQP